MILQTYAEAMNIVSKLFRTLPTFLVLLSLSALGSGQEKKKIAYGMLLDNTGSMRTQFDRVKEIGKAVAQQIYEHGPVSIFDFHSLGIPKDSRAAPILRLEQSQDATVLEECINKLYVEGGQTTLLDAIQFIAERLGEKAGGPDFSDRVIILVTDGEERASAATQKQLARKLKELKIRVYAIGLVQQLDSEGGFTRPSQRSKAIDLLKEITKETSGQVVFPKSNRQDLQSLLAELAIPNQ
jgi:uncharacterized protein with von Willebrand factor type A (vWA) domain